MDSLFQWWTLKLMNDSAKVHDFEESLRSSCESLELFMLYRYRGLRNIDLWVDLLLDHVQESISQSSKP